MSNSMNEIPKTDNKVKRRTIVKGAAWSIPVVAAAVVLPTTAASNAFVLTGTVGALVTCATAPLDLLLKNANGTPVSGPVVVTLPAGLAWADGTVGPKTITTAPGTGQATLQVKSTGLLGPQTINAQGLAPTPTTPVQIIAPVTAAPGAAGRIYRWNAQLTPQTMTNLDPTGIVKDPVQVITNPGGGNGNVQVRTANGEWWAKSDPAPWRQIVAPPIVSLYTQQTASGQSWGLTASGDVYFLNEVVPTGTGTTATTHWGGVTGVTQLFANTANETYALTASGGLYRAAGNSNTPLTFAPVMTSGTPSVPLTGVTVVPSRTDSITATPIVIANGKAYRVSGGIATEIVNTPTTAKDLVVKQSDYAVIDAAGAVWIAQGSSPMTKVTTVGPFTEFIGRGGTAMIGLTPDGRITHFSLQSPTAVYDIQDWTPTQFSTADVLEYSITTNSGNAILMARLPNGDVWWHSETLNTWTKITAPGPILDIDGAHAATTAVAILSGDVVCP